ncbi:MAG TPA: TetR/AcrR family transcriptional regulator [Polyangiaceae bacterium]|jgi:AcrR family transcriptional regulator|nr:TetR/AcrR family transcriptional regulator [Polyangiaceae bacterium]
MRKGEQTRAAIVEAALELAGRDGLEGLTIGLVADRMRMSKSGVFAHFGSREELQIAVLKEYEKRFVEDVLLPSLNEPRGLPRLEAMYGRWIDRISVEISSGCIYVSGAAEYDDRPGPIRDELVGMIRSWQAELVRAIKQAIEVGHLRAETDPMQLVFVLQGFVLSVHFNTRLMHNKDSVTRARSGFSQLVNAYRAPAQSSIRLAPRNRNL